MALVINDRVKETTTTTGTGTVSLGGAVTGFETFAAGIGNSNTVYYCIAHQDQAEFEVGLGTLDGDSSDLARTTIISSSNSDSAVDFSAGTKDVFCTIPASKMLFKDASGTIGNFNAATITANTAFVPDASDGAALGTSSLEFSDLFLADGAVINFGDDQDITLTHTADTGLTTNGTFQATTITATTAFVPDAADGASLGTTSLEISVLFLADGATIKFGNDQDINITHVADTGLTTNGDFTVGDDLEVSGGVIDVKNTGARSEVRFYCESSNAHYAAIKAPAHADFSGNTTLTLPAVTDTIAGIAATQTFTNKTLTTPKIAEIDSLSSGNITLDAEADIILDADGANVVFKDDGTSILDISNDSTDAVLTVSTQDKDLVIKGDDGGSAITALTIDMSDAGKLLPNNGIDVNGKEIILDADADTSITADTDDQIDIRIAGADDFAFKANTFEVQTGSNIDMNGTELILDADGDTSVTADTDDQIDIRIAGADDFQFTANTFTILAGSTLVNSGSQSSDISSTGKAAVFGF